MKITILGSGTCASNLAGIENRFPPGFYVEWEGGGILFDCSEGIRFRLEKMGIDYNQINHVAITHSHPDHFALVHYIQSVFCKSMVGPNINNELNIYAPKHIVNNFPLLWSIYTQERGEEYFDYPVLKFHNMPDEVVEIGSAKLSAKSVYHGFGKVDAVAFRLETQEGIFVYSGDCGDSPELREIARDADFFLCDTSARIGDEDNATGYGHLNPNQVGVISQEARVKTVALTHYFGVDPDTAMMEDCKKSGFAGEVVVAKDFQVIHI